MWYAPVMIRAWPVLVLLSCSTGVACSAEPKHPAPSDEASPTAAASAQVSGSAEPASVAAAPSSAPAPPPRDPTSPFPERWARDTGKEGAVLVRMDLEQTLGVVLTCAAGGAPRNYASLFAGLKLPLFTLYEDGSVIFVRTSGERRVMRVQLDPASVQALLDELQTLGIDRIDSRPRRCDLQQNPRSCMTDAAVSVIELKLPGKKPKTLRNYALVAQHQTELDAVLARLRSFDSKEALDYLPSQAALVMEKCPADVALDSALLARFKPWPFEVQVLWPPQSNAEVWARVVPAEPFYRGLYEEGAPLGTSRGFTHKDRLYTAYVTPLLPGADPKPINDYHHP